ncbi:hypothetical protein [Nostoc sp. UHCC 0870]|uniref:hypothetical protein n=1 Tax=Nostoc sp. UHCC 0870 TaxID=2914041 RepID=UPI001EDCFF38|nr:hypothetical protein [Nostoc sp. UHCC 0870]UKP01539.1 hypothetical protein L6494_30345 [Nostoc sp. UHCC 0870]
MSKTTTANRERAAVNKRIVVCTGDKGGTGKSIVARFLLDMYLANNIHVAAYDCDPHNPQLWRHYNRVLTGGVKTIKFNQWGFSEILKKDLSSLNPVVALMDLPSGVGEYFQDFVQDMADASLGYRITMVSVLGRVKDSIIQLKRLIEFCGNQVDYVVVKNLYWGEDEEEEEIFIRYNESKTRKSALELGAIEVNFLRLVDRVYEAIDFSDLTFTEAVTHESLTISKQARLSVWIPNQESELIKGGNFLRLEGAKPRDRNNLRKGLKNY